MCLLLRRPVLHRRLLYACVYCLVGPLLAGPVYNEELCLLFSWGIFAVRWVSGRRTGVDGCWCVCMRGSPSGGITDALLAGDFTTPLFAAPKCSFLTTTASFT